MPANKQFRMTRQRRIILEELRKTKSHPCAEDIYFRVRERLPHISLGTVYRNLEILSNLGLIKKISFSTNQMHYDGNLDEHYHISCIVCNRIDDIPADVVKNVDFCIPAIENYTVLEHSVHFYGICKSCSSNENVLHQKYETEMVKKYF